MNKRILAVVLAAALLLSSVGMAYAATPEDLMMGMGHKLFRGVVNVLTGWVEIPAQIVKGYNKDNVGGAFVGIFTGVYHGIGRTLSGCGEVAGFWAADPKDNAGIGIPLDAEYAWEEGTHYKWMEPNVGDGALKPMGDKFLRGAGNALLGFVEFPGQIVKGIRLGAYDLGIVKGLWYWYSREIDGIYDITTCLVPNPKDTKALPFDEKWPWTALGESMTKAEK